jgi:hypothetical protein
VLVPLRLKSS